MRYIILFLLLSSCGCGPTRPRISFDDIHCQIEDRGDYMVCHESEVIEEIREIQKMTDRKAIEKVVEDAKDFVSMVAGQYSDIFND